MQEKEDMKRVVFGPVKDEFRMVLKEVVEENPGR
jgi:hypothetical protein